jgi:hypothetical protein
MIFHTVNALHWVGTVLAAGVAAALALVARALHTPPESHNVGTAPDSRLPVIAASKAKRPAGTAFKDSGSCSKA